MLSDLIKALIRDTVRLSESGFFGYLVKKKNILTDVLGEEYPKSLVRFFSEADEEKIAVSLVEALQFLRHQKITVNNAGLLAAFAEFIIDEGWMKFHTEQDVHKGFKHSSEFMKKLFEIENTHVLRFDKASAAYLKKVGRYKLLACQMPRESDDSFKRSLHSEVQKHYPGYYLIFSVNTSLIGGMRCFKDGHMYDASWLSQVIH